MKKLLILGAGQYGFAVKEIAKAVGCYTEISFLDDCHEIAIGKLEDIDKIEYDEACVAIGNPIVRARWLQRIDRAATLIHPRAQVAPSALIGKGCIIEAGAVICTGAKLGDGAIVMANATVGHNAEVGNYCQLKYNSTVSDNDFLPDCTKLECNVSFKAQVK